MTGRALRARALRWLCACAVGLVAAAAAPAQPAPATVRIVLPFAPGSALDAQARALAEALHEVTGRSYIVDNKPGAGGQIGSAEVARARPDGGVVLLTTGGHTTNAALYKHLPYDSVADFTPITQITSPQGFLLLVNAESGFKTAQDFIAAARARPGALSYGSAGVGNTTHLIGALFAQAAGIRLLHVPYKGSAVNDLLGGQIDAIFLGTTISRPLLAGGRVRALAVSGSERAAYLPQVPSFADLGFKGVDVPAWNGLLGPKGMSPATAERIRREVAQAVTTAAYRRTASTLEMQLLVSAPKDFAAYLQSEIVRLRTQLGPLGIEID